LGEGGRYDGEGYGEFEDVEAVVVWGFVVVVIVFVIVGFWGSNSRGNGRVIRWLWNVSEFGV